MVITFALPERLFDLDAPMIAPPTFSITLCSELLSATSTSPLGVRQSHLGLSNSFAYKFTVNPSGASGLSSFQPITLLKLVDDFVA